GGQTLLDVDRKREVERRDDPDYPDRFADHRYAAQPGRRDDGSARCLHPRDIVFDELAVVVGRLDGAANLNEVGDEAGRADLGDDQLPKFRFALIEYFSEPLDDLRPFPY